MGRVFSTQNFDLIRVSQYLMNGLKGGCKGLEYSKTPKKTLSSSTGMTPETLIYHNACNLKVPEWENSKPYNSDPIAIFKNFFKNRGDL